MRISAVVMVSIVLGVLFAVQANAASTYSVSIRFEAGEMTNSSYPYLKIVQENSTKPSYINVTANLQERVVYIEEYNVEKVEMDVDKALKTWGLSIQDAKTYLQMADKFRIIVSGHGVNTYVLKNVPEVLKIYRDGIPFEDYSYKDGELTIVTTMSEHVFTIYFKNLTMIVMDVVKQCLLVALIFMTLMVVYGIWNYGLKHL